MIAPVATPDRDARVLVETDEYRAVAPQRNGMYINGDIYIEKKSKDALGHPLWLRVGEVERPTHSAVSSLEEAMFHLLAAAGGAKMGH